MRILIATGIFPPESGGPATYSRALAIFLSKKGHEVSVVTYGDERTERPDAFRIHIVSQGGSAFLRYVRYAWTAYRAARHSDLVFLQGAVSEGFPGTIGAMLAGRPTVLRVPGDYAWERYQGRGGRKLLDVFLQEKHHGIIGWLERIERWVARRAQSVITPSAYLKSVVIRWGVPPEKIHVVLNAIDPLPDGENATELRKKLGLERKTILLCAARTVPWKGGRFLLDILKRLPDSHVLVWAGDGPGRTEWEMHAKAIGVEERAFFLGALSRAELASWYRAADALVLASGYEGYPFVVPEAVSTGLPCFVSDQGGNPETKQSFPKHVTVLPYEDEETWTRALVSIPAKKSAVAVSGTMLEDAEHLLANPRSEDDGKPVVVMFGYERELLHEDSDAFLRIRSLAGSSFRIRAFVLSALSKDTGAGDEVLSAHAWSGTALRRWLATVRAGIRLAKTASERTVISAQDPFAAGLAGYVVSRWTKCPLEIQEHGDFFSGYWERDSFQNRLLGSFGRLLLRRADRVRAVSERVKSHLERIGVKPERIDVIPVAQNLDELFFYPFPAFETVESVRIVVPCRFVKQKGLDVLLGALSRVKEKGLGFHVKIIGAGPLENALKERIRRIGLETHAEIRPWMPREALWKNADLFVLSSRYEGWGRTVVEAMAAGVPVVATETGCVGSFFRPGIDGYSVTIGDEEVLADTIAEAIKSPKQRKAFAEAARERARSFPSAEMLAERQRRGWSLML